MWRTPYKDRIEAVESSISGNPATASLYHKHAPDCHRKELESQPGVPMRAAVSCSQQSCQPHIQSNRDVFVSLDQALTEAGMTSALDAHLREA